VSIPPAGITPAASFELNGFEPQRAPPVILADKIDPLTGEFLSLTKTYTVAEGMATYLSAVQRSTGAAVRNIGHRFRELKHVDEQAPELAESMARQALQPAVDAGVLQFDRIESEVHADDGSQLGIETRFIDLGSPRQDRTRRVTFKP
jgi:hypothetical protein